VKHISLSLAAACILFSASLSAQTVRKQLSLAFDSFNGISDLLKSGNRNIIQKDSFAIILNNFTDAQKTELLAHSSIDKFRNEAKKKETFKLDQAVRDNKNVETTTTKDDNGKPVVSIQIHILMNDMDEKAKDSVIFHFGNKKSALGTFTIIFDPGAKPDGDKPQTNDGKPKRPTLAELVKMIKVPDVSVPIPDLSDCKAADIANPLDDNEITPTNKIVYVADKNLTFWYDKNGDLHKLGKGSKLYDGTKDYYTLDHGKLVVKKDRNDNFTRRNIVVPANSSLTFEVIDVNPAVFDVQITDTAIAFNTDTNRLIGLLVSGPAGAGAQAFSSEEEKKYTPTVEDSIRVAAVKFIQQMESLQLSLANSCLNFQNRIVAAKIAAKKNIDEYFAKKFTTKSKPPLQDFSSWFGQFLDGKDKEDSTLSATFLAYYNQLVGTYYKNIAQIPEVDGSYDKIRFTFDIKPKPNSPYSAPVRSKSIDAFVTGGFKIDVSSGLYYASFDDQKYSTRADSTTLKGSEGTDSVVNRRGKLFAEPQSKSEVGFVSFLHFYPKISPNFNISANIGAGVSFASTPQLRYFAGIGILLGKENRFAINAGVAFGNVNRLSNQYYDSLHNLISISAAEVGKDLNYTKHMDIKPFISITYNLGFLHKKENTQQTVSPKATDSQAGNAAPATPAKDKKADTNGGGN